MGHKPKTRQPAKTERPANPPRMPVTKHVAIEHDPAYPLGAILSHYASVAASDLSELPPRVNLNIAGPTGAWVATLRRVD